MRLFSQKPATTWKFFLMMSAAMLMACNAEVGPDRSTGRTNEILVVTNSKTMWEGGVGYIVREFFEQALPGLPQPEPMFHLFNVADEAFNKVFKAQHNILIIDINQKYEQPMVETGVNYWTSPQRVIKIKAPDSASFRKAFEDHKNAFMKAYNENEIVRTNEQFKMARSVKLKNIVEKKFGFSIQIPNGFQVAADDNNFMWLKQSMRKLKQDVELGIIIYERPYVDTNSFSESEILILRDSLTSMFIAGPSEGSFMILSKDFIAPVFKRRDDFVTGFAVETRGLWMVHNNFMGGPFISYTFLDPELNRVITVDGYVYNPADIKRNFIRQMEAIFHTISFEN